MLLIFLSFIIYLFTLYVLANDDFVLLRKAITLEQVFDIAIVTGLGGLLFSRLVFIFFHFARGYLNPFVFFLFPYFPGLSLVGGVGGGILCLFLLVRSQKMPHGRLFDIFSLAILSAVSTGYILQLISHFLQRKQIASVDAIVGLLFFIVFLVFSLIFIPRQRRAQIQDGTITLLFLFIFSSIEFFHQFVLLSSKRLWQNDTIISILIGIGSLILLFSHEKLIKRGKRLF